MTTVSDDFKSNLSRVNVDTFLESMQQAGTGQEWRVTETQTVSEEDFEQFYMLSISSPLFRVILLLHFSDEMRTRQFVAEQLNINPNNLTDGQFYDFLGEIGNTYCGAIKRELGRFEPSLGMSTPNRLAAPCAQFIEALRCQYACHAKADMAGDTIMKSSIFLSAYGDLDYDKQQFHSQEDEVDSGELEFF